jgi:hypothetical protein
MRLKATMAFSFVGRGAITARHEKIPGCLPGISKKVRLQARHHDEAFGTGRHHGGHAMRGVITTLRDLSGNSG